MEKYWVSRIVKVLVMVLLGALIFGFLVEGLWNWLVPDLFGGRAITFVQAIGLILLCRTLVGGFHHRGGRSRWKHGMHAKLAGMSPEERERFRAAFKDRRGDLGGKYDSPSPAARTDE